MTPTRIQIEQLEERLALATVRNFAAVGGTPNGQIALFGASDGTITLNASTASVDDPARGAFLGLLPGLDKVAIRPLVGDFTGDGTNDIVFATGPGVKNSIIVLDGTKSGTDRSQYQLFSPFEESFTGGLFVSSGDINGDGTPDLIVTPDQGGGGVVAVFDGAKLFATIVPFGQNAEITRFFGIDDRDFRGGARSAVGDINGDKQGDLVIAAGTGGGPRIAIYDGKTFTSTRTKLIGDFFVFESTLRNGANLSAGDFDGDGKDDIVFGAGNGGAPRVRIVNGSKLLTTVNPFDSSGKQSSDSVLIKDFLVQSNYDSQGVSVLARRHSKTETADLIVAFVATTQAVAQRIDYQLVNYYTSNDLNKATPVVSDSIALATVATGTGGPYVG